MSNVPFTRLLRTAVAGGSFWVRWVKNNQPTCNCQPALKLRTCIGRSFRPLSRAGIFIFPQRQPIARPKGCIPGLHPFLHPRLPWRRFWFVTCHHRPLHLESPSSGRGSPLSPTFAPCRDGLGPWRVSSASRQPTQRVANVAAVLGHKGVIGGSPAKASPKPKLPENDAPSARQKQHQMVPYRVPRFSERFPYWCRTARIGPVSICVNLPGKKRKRAAASGDPLWSCATHVATAHGLTEAEGMGLEPTTPYGAPHFQCAWQVT